MAQKAQKASQPRETAVLETVDLPSDLRAEKAVLAAILLDNTSYYEALAVGLELNDFHYDSNRRIYTAIGVLVSEGRPVDTVTLCEILGKKREIEAVGGIGYLASLTEGAIRLTNLEHYIDILHEKRLRRELIYLSNRSIVMAGDQSEPIKIVLQMTAEQLMYTLGNCGKNPGQRLSQFSADVLRELEELMTIDRLVIGLPFGIQDLDEATTGMRKGETIILAGFPGSGKTGFAISIMCTNCAAGKPIAFFSLEMRRSEVLLRILSQVSGVSHGHLRNPRNLTRSDLASVKRYAEQIDHWPLIIDDSTNINIRELDARARLHIQRDKAELIVVDYLQLCTTSDDDKEYERVSRVANVLTSLAKETGVPVLALSQLSRSDKKDPNARPNMQMLRGSGQIEQNAHLVLFTYHPVDEKNDIFTGDDEIVIGKQRAGIIGKIPAYYHPTTLKWEERGDKREKPKQESLVMPAAEEEKSDF